jgi:hypothetical protein
MERKQTQTLLGGYLAYLIAVFLSFPEDERELILLSGSPGPLEWIQSNPFVSKVLLYLVAAALTLLLVGLGLRGLIVP